MTPLFVADYSTGLFTAKDEWIAPGEAFSRLENVRVQRGKLIRRDGYKIFGFFPSMLESSGTALTLTWTDSSDDVQVTTSSAHGLSTGDAVYFRDVQDSGATNIPELHNKKFFITVTDTDEFTLDNIAWSELSATPDTPTGTAEHLKSVSKVGEIDDAGITAADPVAITTKSAHGLSTGNTVLVTSDFSNEITDPSGSFMESLDGTIDTVHVLSTTTSVLDNVSTIGFGTHTSGGDVSLVSDDNDNEIVGLGELFKDAATNLFLAFNVKRMAQWDPSLGNFKQVEHDTQTYANVFSGTETEYFDIANAFGRLWITNFKDRPQTYDGTTFDNAEFDIDNDTNNEITKVRHIFQYNRRVVLLYTVESGTTFAQRARWSRIDFGTGSTNEWDDQADDTNAGSLDADTDEEIISAEFLGDKLIVFFERSIWSLEKTGSVDPPFRWVKIAENPGPFGSPFGVVGHNQFIWSTGQGGVIATDGHRIEQADPDIPDFEDEIAQGDFNRVFAFKDVNSRQTWIAYPSITGSPNNQVRVFDYENGTWTNYDIALNVASEFTGAITARTWADFNVNPDDLWKNTNKRWSEYAAPRGDPKILFGNNQGIIYRAHDGTSDAGTKVKAQIDSMRFNPFKQNGQSAHLVYIDFIFSEVPDTEITVQLFRDFENIPYSTQFLDLENDSGQSGVIKIWKRVYVNEIANSHKIVLFNESQGDTYTQHGMILWFKPGGRFDLL